MNPLKSIAINISIPLLVSTIFFGIISYKSNIPNVVFTFIPYMFYLISILVIWVSWRFNRNIFIFLILPLVLSLLGFEYLNSFFKPLLFDYISILFPLHLLFFLLFKERGLFSTWGALKLLFLLCEVGIVFYLIHITPVGLGEILETKLFAASFEPLKDIAIAMMIFSAFVLGALIMFNRYLVYNSSFLVILLNFILGLYYFELASAFEISLLSTSVIMFVVLIRESYRLAFYDELTDLPGRRALIEDMAKLGKTYSLAMIDIDFFKKFNDTYGHDTGDEVLKMVASKLANVSGGGKAYRYGGEEFVILFPYVGIDSAYIHVESLRDIVSRSAFNVRNKSKDKKIFVNISSGIAQNSQKDKNPFSTMKTADKALYKAKKSGRNIVIKA